MERKSSNEAQDERAFQHMTARSPGHMPVDPSKIRDFRQVDLMKESVDASRYVDMTRNNPYNAVDAQKNARRLRQMK